MSARKAGKNPFAKVAAHHNDVAVAANASRSTTRHLQPSTTPSMVDTFHPNRHRVLNPTLSKRAREDAERGDARLVAKNSNIGGVAVDTACDGAGLMILHSVNNVACSSKECGAVGWCPAIAALGAILGNTQTLQTHCTEGDGGKDEQHHERAPSPISVAVVGGHRVKTAVLGPPIASSYASEAHVYATEAIGDSHGTGLLGCILTSATEKKDVAGQSARAIPSGTVPSRASLNAADADSNAVFLVPQGWRAPHRLHEDTLSKGVERNLPAPLRQTHGLCMRSASKSDVAETAREMTALDSGGNAALVPTASITTRESISPAEVMQLLRLSNSVRKQLVLVSAEKACGECIKGIALEYTDTL